MPLITTLYDLFGNVYDDSRVGPAAPRRAELARRHQARLALRHGRLTAPAVHRS